jgi:hypothetical protein
VSKRGHLTVHWLPDEEPDRPTCALDVAEQAGGLTPSEIAALIGVSKQRVTQIEEKAKRKMRKPMRGHDT